MNVQEVIRYATPPVRNELLDDWVSIVFGSHADLDADIRDRVRSLLTTTSSELEQDPDVDRKWTQRILAKTTRWLAALADVEERFQAMVRHVYLRRFAKATGPLGEIVRNDGDLPST
jgi:hypothetical protein